MHKIMSIVGARPQFVKAAVLRRLFGQAHDFEELLVHTGQHYDANMSKRMFDDLRIDAPNYHLDINGGNHGDMTGRMLSEIEKILLKERPDACIVYGDTNSTLAGALAAVKLHIPVVHIEAGLRSFNRKMPEEINRIATDCVSDLLFCSTSISVANLQNENIIENVHHVGDLMYDVILMVKEQIQVIKTIQGHDLGGNNIATCTIHRQENVDDPKRLQDIFDFLNDRSIDHKIMLPLHPRTKQSILNYSIDTGRIILLEPVGYLEMQALISHSDYVLTDSGGMQKEAYFHGKKCVVLRDETEWVELVDAGWSRVWTSKEYAEPKNVPDYGNGDSGKLILAEIRKYLS